MTLDEKVAQLGSFWAFEVVRGSASTRPLWRRSPRTASAQITRWPGSTNLRPVEVAVAANAIQRYLVEETRLGIPAIVHEECLHGLIAWAAPCFQQSIGAAATLRLRTSCRRWPRRSGGGCSLTGARHALAPVFDIASRPALGPHRGDLRRGPVPRGRARLRLHPRRSRAPTSNDGVVATGKHMVGHGLAEGGLNQAPAHIGRARAPRRAAVPVRGSGPPVGDRAAIMPAYCDVDGVPCHASTELLTGDPPRRVGLRRHRRLGLHRRSRCSPRPIA